MKSNSELLGVLLLFVITASCNKKLFVEKHLVIEKQKGIMVFIDKESRMNRKFGEGDIFTTKDSLIMDFFIPYKFSKKIITKADIDKALLTKDEQKATFFYLLRDCKDENRTSSIDVDCLAIILDRNIDNYLHSNKIFVQPVEIEIIKGKTDREYYELHKNLIIRYKNKLITLTFNKGYFDILQTNVLEYDWK